MTAGDTSPPDGPNSQGRSLAERPTFLSFALLGIFLAVFNCFVFPMASGGGGGGAALLLFSLGVIAAEVGLVALWGVFSGRGFLHRVAGAAALGVGFYSCFAIGVVAAWNFGPSLPLPAVVVFFCFAPLVFFAVQAPLWILRLWFAWRIDLEQRAPSGSYGRSMQIKDVILGTVAVAVSLAVVRLGIRVLPDSVADSEILLSVVATVGGAGLASALSLPPLTYFLLGVRDGAASALGVAIWFAIAMVAFVLIPMILFPIPLREVVLLGLVVPAFLGVICTALILIRSEGYVLHRKPPPEHA